MDANVALYNKMQNKRSKVVQLQWDLWMIRETLLRIHRKQGFSSAQLASNFKMTNAPAIINNRPFFGLAIINCSDIVIGSEGLKSGMKFLNLQFTLTQIILVNISTADLHAVFEAQHYGIVHTTTPIPKISIQNVTRVQTDDYLDLAPINGIAVQYIYLFMKDVDSRIVVGSSKPIMIMPNGNGQLVFRELNTNITGIIVEEQKGGIEQKIVFGRGSISTNRCPEIIQKGSILGLTPLIVENTDGASMPAFPPKLLINVEKFGPLALESIPDTIVFGSLGIKEIKFTQISIGCTEQNTICPTYDVTPEVNRIWASGECNDTNITDICVLCYLNYYGVHRTTPIDVRKKCEDGVWPKDFGFCVPNCGNLLNFSTEGDFNLHYQYFTICYTTLPVVGTCTYTNGEETQSTTMVTTSTDMSSVVPQSTKYLIWVNEAIREAECCILPVFFSRLIRARET
ncbi:uncharacterized protein LOC142349428 isoform X2 [Convolutriloba macropyga]|uniref:uncharacterized protein LOC142349428 isoform X2 n=1 Tax=Convolutriloba macropyga TaxID=536237 RepID=UPI003F5203E0